MFAGFAARHFTSFFLVIILLGLAGCQSESPTNPNITAESYGSSVSADALHAGDQVRVTIFGDPELSGEYTVDNRGNIVLPLVGDIPAQGQSTKDVELSLIEILEQGYIVNPKVSIDIISLRPFYILGEVNSPGSYPMFPELDVFKAIATAGGLTPRAVHGEYLIYRGFGDQRREIKAGDETPILPGDSIRVKQRFF